MKNLLRKLQSKSLSTKSGFTMTEVSIAILFIGLLLITIAIITTNLVAIYQKGSTLKAVNNVGRSLIDNFTSAINSAPSVDTTSLCSSLVDPNNENAVERCVQDRAYGFIYHANYAPSSSRYAGRQYNGIFCTGNYSYLWNTYYGQEDGKLIQLEYLRDDDAKSVVKAQDLRLIRVKDPTYRVCSSVMGESYQHSDEFNSSEHNIVTINIEELAHNNTRNPIPEPESGFLTSFDTDLMLYELTVFPISQDLVTLRTYIAGNFILATLRGDVDVLRSGDYCQGGIIQTSSSDDSSSIFTLGAEYNYCGINKFSFAARTAGV